MAAITLHRIDGVTLANGKQAYGSREMSLWLPTFLRFMREVHGIRLVVIKVADLVATLASAGTHVGGYATDLRTWNLTTAQQRRLIYEGTRLGMPGHLRTRGQGFDPHCHAMLDVGYTTPCSYQIARTRLGRDALARNGADLDREHRPPQPWASWSSGLVAMLRQLTPTTPPKPAPKPAPTPAVTPIPRHVTPQPWMVIPVDGVLSGTALSRLQWQLQIKPTGLLDHWTIRALKVWLGNPDDGRGILSPLNVQQMQYRVGVPRTGKWDSTTTRALQIYLNLHNPTTK